MAAIIEQRKRRRVVAVSEAVHHEVEFVWKVTDVTYVLHSEPKDPTKPELKLAFVLSPVFTCPSLPSSTAWRLQLVKSGEKTMPKYGLSLENRSDVDLTVDCLWKIGPNSKAPPLTRSMLNTVPAHKFFGYADVLPRQSIIEDYLVNGELTVEVRLRVIQKEGRELVHVEGDDLGAITQPPSAHEHVCRLAQNLKRALENGAAHSDVTLVLADESRMPAHKFILAARSSFFEAMFNTPMQENLTQTVDLHSIPANVCRAVIEFIYTDTCTESVLAECVQEIFEAADQYDIPDLKVLCEREMLRQLSVHSVVNVLLLADAHRAESLKQACIEFTVQPENFHQVRATEDFQKLCARVPDLVVGLLECSIEPPNKRQRTR